MKIYFAYNFAQMNSKDYGEKEILPRTRVLFLTTAPLCPRYGKGVLSGGTFHDILNADIPIHLIIS